MNNINRILYKESTHWTRQIDLGITHQCDYSSALVKKTYLSQTTGKNLGKISVLKAMELPVQPAIEEAGEGSASSLCVNAMRSINNVFTL